MEEQVKRIFDQYPQKDEIFYISGRFYFDLTDETKEKMFFLYGEVGQTFYRNVPKIKLKNKTKK